MLSASPGYLRSAISTSLDADATAVTTKLVPLDATNESAFSDVDFVVVVEQGDEVAGGSGELLALCETARAHEETWVNFKLFGLMGLTIAFVILQAIYLSRHITEDSMKENAEEKPES